MSDITTVDKVSGTVEPQFNDQKTRPRNARSGLGAYTGAAHCHVYLATVLLRPPSGHRPGRHQARHAPILQIGLQRLVKLRLYCHPVSVTLWSIRLQPASVCDLGQQS